jgi:hypothetical protein
VIVCVAFGHAETVTTLVTTTVSATVDGPSLLVGSALADEEVTSLELAVELGDSEAESVISLSMADEVEEGSAVTIAVLVTTSTDVTASVS